MSLRPLFGGQAPAPGFFDGPLMTMRPEQLSVGQFVELTNMVAREAGSALPGDDAR